MKTRRILTGLFLLLFVLAMAPSNRPSDEEPRAATPVPIDDIPELTDFASLQEVFNRDAGHVRLVALLSPSCGYCIKGYRYMRKILDEVPGERLKMYVIWEPMLSGDSRELAARMSRKAKDPRMVYQAWDNERVTGKTWQASMDLEGIAWDVYFLYGADVQWGEDGPSQPDYWQHQGASDEADRLDYGTLKAKVEDMLAQAG